MADENETGAPVDVVAAAAEAPAPKKQRAPRRSKAEIAATITSPKVRQKRTVKTEAAPAAIETPAAKTTRSGPNAPGKAKGVRKIETSTVVDVATGDDMADLLKLEEENKTLRATLAEKLRAENADLRKRLGA
jgi:putative transposase